MFYQLKAEAITKDLLEEYKAKRIPCEFRIRFDGINRWYDRTRGTNGAPAHAETAIRLCREYGFPVSCVMCLQKNSVSTIRESVCYLAALGVHSLKLNAARPKSGGTHPSESFLSTAELFHVFLRYIPEYFADDCPLNIEMDSFFLYARGQEHYCTGLVRDTSHDDPLLLNSMTCEFRENGWREKISRAADPAFEAYQMRNSRESVS